MLHLRETSDLHLEHYYDLYDSQHKAKSELLRLIPHLPTDKKTVLIVAGDLATARRPQRIRTFMELMTKRFKHVIYVLGNHEHYGSVMDKALPDIENCLAEAEKDGTLDLNKITVAGNEPVKVKIGDVTFLCGTMWTSYGEDLPNVDQIRYCVSKYITDHRVITHYDLSGVPPSELAEVFKNTVTKFGAWMKGQDNSKTVVVTHHMPSFDAVDPFYMHTETMRQLNHAFTSNLNDFIIEHQPALWFFGHTHSKYIGKIGETTLHCNPLGYPHEPTASNNLYDTTMVYSL